MKILATNSSRQRGRRVMHGFTLPEILIAVTIFMLMIGGIIATNLFGLRMFQLTQTKLDVTQWSRETTMRLTDEIHICNNAQVGTVSNGFFTGFLDGEPQSGSALMINLTTNTTNYIIYFVNTADQTLRRTTDQPNSTQILASSVTNTVAFMAQDFTGNVLTNNLNSRIIHILLEFYQPGRFLQGSDYYKLETSVKQRIVP